MAGRLSDSLSLATRGLGEHILLLVDEGELHQPLREAVGGRRGDILLVQLAPVAATAVNSIPFRAGVGRVVARVAGWCAGLAAGWSTLSAGRGPGDAVAPPPPPIVIKATQ